MPAPLPTDRFSDLADAYAQARPAYPLEVIDWCLRLSSAPPRTIVDLGCGTGISTRLFAKDGARTIGIEPNAAMLAKAKSEGRIEFRSGTSTATGLPDASADLIVSATAFHWFELPGTFHELARIATPAAWNVALWNRRKPQGAFMLAYEDLLRSMSSEYEVYGRGMDRYRELQQFFHDDIREAALDHSVPMDLTRLRALAMSSSYVQFGVADKDALLERLDTLYAEHAGPQGISMLYTTYAIAWPAHIVPRRTSGGPA
ncbi:MAG TPA: methyltransferase domain-containing protein [Flavobacteriales bacterium]